MRPCPVCEAPVTGWQCEVCGKQVGTSPAAANLNAPLEGFEPTLLPTEVLGLPIEVAPGLEPTSVTQVGSAQDVGAGGLQDLDSGRVAPDGPPAVAPTVATCRYCRNVQTSGLFCDRCGMRLPWARPSSAAVTAAPQENDRRVCKRCGERSPASMERCGACGNLLVSEG